MSRSRDQGLLTACRRRCERSSSAPRPSQPQRDERTDQSENAGDDEPGYARGSALGVLSIAQDGPDRVPFPAARRETVILAARRAISTPDTSDTGVNLAVTFDSGVGALPLDGAVVVTRHRGVGGTVDGDRVDAIPALVPSECRFASPDEPLAHKIFRLACVRRGRVEVAFDAGYAVGALSLQRARLQVLWRRRERCVGMGGG